MEMAKTILKGTGESPTMNKKNSLIPKKLIPSIVTPINMACINIAGLYFQSTNHKDKIPAKIA